MRRTRLGLSVILLLIGTVWVGQGSGAVAGSAMTGSAFWAIVGAIVLVVGAAIGLARTCPTTGRTALRQDVQPTR